MVKNLPAKGDTRDVGLIPGLKFSWRRKWLLTPEFLPGKSQDRGTCRVTVHGGLRESDSTEHAHTH